MFFSGFSYLSCVTASDVDVILGALSTTLASVGGFCVGSREVTDHQRLSGLGYCFSASAPPFLCATATTALEQMRKHPEKLARLQQIAQKAHEQLASVPYLQITSTPRSPVVHLTLAQQLRQTIPSEQADEIMQFILKTVSTSAWLVVGCF